MEAATAAPRRRRHYGRRTAAVAFFALLLYAAIAAATDARALLGHARGFQTAVLAPALFLVVVGWCVRAVRWHVFLRALHAPTTPSASLLTYLGGFALGVTPGRIGEVVKTYWLRERTATPIAKSLAAVVAERATDLLGLSLLAAIGLLAWPTFGPWPALAGLVLVGVATTAIRNERAAGAVLRMGERIPLVRKAVPSLRTAHASVRILLGWQGMLLGTAFGFTTWCLETTALYLLADGFGLTLTWLQCALVQSAGSLLGVASLLPGGIGAKEGGMIGILVVLDVPLALAAGLALAFRLATLWFGVAVGGVALLVLRMTARTGPSEGADASAFTVVGTHVSAVDMGAALRFAEAAVAERRKTHVCVCSVNMIMQARHQPGLRTALDTAGLVVPDGYPITRVGRRRVGPRVGRVRGTDLVRNLSELGASKGYRFYFYGGAPGVAQGMADALARAYPGLRVAGVESPPFRPLTEAEQIETCERINQTRADVVWIGLGCPRQEIWVVENRHRLDAPLLIPIGAAFDFLAGTKREAPRWFRAIGLEWLWRLAQEPRRLWRRVLIEGPHFFALLAREARAQPPRPSNRLKAEAPFDADGSAQS